MMIVPQQRLMLLWLLPFGVLPEYQWEADAL
jgi:hypothetical protein